MKKYIAYILGTMLMTMVFSCEKGLITYTDKPDVYFYASGRAALIAGEVLTDSVAISFSLAKAKDSVVQIIVAASGGFADHDRTYNLSVNPASTAISEVHYDALPTTFTMKRNKLLDTIPLKIHRTTDMQEETFSLIFDLKDNENFATMINHKVLNSTTDEKLSFVTYRVLMNDILKKPSRWFDPYLGKFTREKLLLMVEIMDVDPAYLDGRPSIAVMNAYGKYMQRYLDEQKVAGNIIYEKDKSEMIMGPLVQ